MQLNFMPAVESLRASQERDAEGIQMLEAEGCGDTFVANAARLRCTIRDAAIEILLAFTPK